MTDEEKIQAVVEAYHAAYVAQDATGCAALYDEIAVLLSPWEAPVHGPARIARTHERWFTEAETNKTMEIADLVVSGHIAICLLHFSADIPSPNGGLERTEGTSLNTLKRQPDGGWKLLHTSLNVIEPAEAEGDG